MLKSFSEKFIFLYYQIMDHYKDCVNSPTQSNYNHHVPTQTIIKSNLATENILAHILPRGSED